MSYNMRIEPKVQNILDMEISETEDGEWIETFRDGEKIGSVHVAIDHNVASIYNLEIVSRYR